MEPKLIIMELTSLHHHGGEAIALARQGHTVAFINTRRGVIEAVLKQPDETERAAIQAALEAKDASRP